MHVLIVIVSNLPDSRFVPYINSSRLSGMKLLGLASGGGQQMPVFTAAGAECTVLDYSDSQRKAGFTLTAVYEDFDNDPDAISDGIPAYWASRAVKQKKV